MAATLRRLPISCLFNPPPAAASNVNLLVFSAVGLLLPFRLHLALHTLNAAVNAAFGLHPFCAGRLLSSAATAGRAQAFHRWAAVAATSLAPGSMRLVPQSERLRGGGMMGRDGLAAVRRLRLSQLAITCTWSPLP